MNCQGVDVNVQVNSLFIGSHPKPILRALTFFPGFQYSCCHWVIDGVVDEGVIDSPNSDHNIYKWPLT